MTDRAASILETLARHGLIEHAVGWSLTTLPGGATSRTFSALDPSGQPALTVRLARPELGDWLRHEAAVLRELSAAARPCVPGSVAHVEAPDLPGSQLLAHAHVDGAPARLESVDAAALEALATCLAWVHGHARDGYMLWPSLAVHHGTRADCYRARVATLRLHPAARALPAVERLLDRIDALDLPASTGWDEPGFALIHGDLSPGNILWDGHGGVTLIDWEYARDGDPAEELASLLAEHDLAPDIVADLGAAYAAASGDPSALARMPAWLPYVALDSAIWWANHLPRHGGTLDDTRIEDRLEQTSRYLGA